MAASLIMRQQISPLIDMSYALSQLAEGYILRGNLALAGLRMLASLSR